MLVQPFLFVKFHIINPLKRDCHQLPKWGRLKEHFPSCVVLVIEWQSLWTNVCFWDIIIDHVHGIVEFMCWTLEAHVLSEAYYKYVLKIQDIILVKKRWVVQDQEKLSRKDPLLGACNGYMKTELSETLPLWAWGSIWRSLHQACAWTRNQERWLHLNRSR